MRENDAALSGLSVIMTVPIIGLHPMLIYSALLGLF